MAKWRRIYVVKMHVPNYISSFIIAYKILKAFLFMFPFYAGERTAEEEDENVSSMNKRDARSVEDIPRLLQQLKQEDGSPEIITDASLADKDSRMTLRS